MKMKYLMWGVLLTGTVGIQGECSTSGLFSTMGKPMSVRQRLAAQEQSARSKPLRVPTPPRDPTPPTGIPQTKETALIKTAGGEQLEETTEAAVTEMIVGLSKADMESIERTIREADATLTGETEPPGRENVADTIAVPDTGAIRGATSEKVIKETGYVKAWNLMNGLQSKITRSLRQLAERTQLGIIEAGRIRTEIEKMRATAGGLANTLTTGHREQMHVGTSYIAECVRMGQATYRRQEGNIRAGAAMNESDKVASITSDHHMSLPAQIMLEYALGMREKMRGMVASEKFRALRGLVQVRGGVWKDVLGEADQVGIADEPYEMMSLLAEIGFDIERIARWPGVEVEPKTANFRKLQIATLLARLLPAMEIVTRIENQRAVSDELAIEWEEKLARMFDMIVAMARGGAIISAEAMKNTEVLAALDRGDVMKGIASETIGSIVNKLFHEADERNSMEELILEEMKTIMIKVGRFGSKQSMLAEQPFELRNGNGEEVERPLRQINLYAAKDAYAEGTTIVTNINTAGWTANKERVLRQGLTEPEEREITWRYDFAGIARTKPNMEAATGAATNPTEGGNVPKEQPQRRPPPGKPMGAVQVTTDEGTTDRSMAARERARMRMMLNKKQDANSGSAMEVHTEPAIVGGEKPTGEPETKAQDEETKKSEARERARQRKLTDMTKSTAGVRPEPITPGGGPVPLPKRENTGSTEKPPTDIAPVLSSTLRRRKFD